MKLSTKGEFATRALLELARLDGVERASVSELSARTAIAPKYLEQIMLRLRDARIVRSERGVKGGYSLAHDAGAITVGEVVRVMEGPLAPAACASRSAHVPCPAYRCPSEDDCVMRHLWLEVRDAIAGVLDSTTFKDLADRQEALETAGRRMYYI